MNDTRAKQQNVQDHGPMVEHMKRDVVDGLSRSPKQLPSKYLYDARGAELFERICAQPEYYLTHTETAILRSHAGDMADRIGPQALIIEPGSGSGEKTRLLLKHLHEPAAYVPIDISREQLTEVAAELSTDFPALEVLPVCADFMGSVEIPTARCSAKRRIVFFPGSTIGNMVPEASVDLLSQMRAVVGVGGAVLIGVDLKKDSKLLLPAYDDAAGVSADFALNYLDRMNSALDADFERERFDYEATYDEHAGRIEMYLVSRCDQVVRVADRAIHFQADERILTEYSYKYSIAGFSELAGRAGFASEDVWTDKNELFSVHYLTA